MAGWLGVLKSGAPRTKSWSDQCLDSGLGKLPDLPEPPCLPLQAGADNGHPLQCKLHEDRDLSLLFPAVTWPGQGWYR